LFDVEGKEREYELNRDVRWKFFSKYVEFRGGRRTPVSLRFDVVVALLLSQHLPTENPDVHQMNPSTREKLDRAHAIDIKYTM